MKCMPMKFRACGCLLNEPWSQAVLYLKHSTEGSEACFTKNHFYKKIVGILVCLASWSMAAAVALFRNLLEIKVLRSHHKPTEAEPEF